MTVSLKDRIIRIKNWVWIRVFALLAFSAVIMLNSINLRSPFVGISASLVFIYLSSVATGEIFFPNEKRFLKQMLGLASFVLVIALLGIALILIVRFTETLSLVSLVAVGLGLSMFSAVRNRGNTQPAPKPETVEGAEHGKNAPYLLVLTFLIPVAIAFYALVIARTGEGQVSVWRYIPSYFLPVFFVASLSLILVLFFTRIHVGLKLALISVYSFLSHSLFLIVWYPGRYGDPWSYLGNARFIDNTGTFYAYEWLYSQRLIADIIKYEAQYSLIVFFRRMFTMDIYWVHVFLIPLLWAVFTPILFYKIAELLNAKNTTRFPLFCALGSSLFSFLIYWGAVATAFSLGLLLLLFSVTLFLYWVNSRSKRILFLSLLAAVGSLLAHPTTGIFALSFFFVGVIIQSRLPKILKLAFFVLASVAYPYVSYLQRATFSEAGLLDLDNFLSFQIDIATPLLIFGFLGLVLSIRGKVAKRRVALLLLLFYVLVAANYYVSMYGMKDAVVPQRILGIGDILLVPFVVLGLMVTANFLKYGFSRAKANPHRFLVGSRSIAVFLICVFTCVLATSALYQAYPRQEITEVQPAAYELEAIRYIDSISEGRYVVLGDTNLATLAGGFLGIDYSYGSYSAKGNFGIPEWIWWNMKLYQQMIMTPSLTVLENAMARDRVGISYFVVSIREPNYADIVRRTSAVLEANKTWEGKLTVWRYTSPTIRITGNGPLIKTAFDGGPFIDVQTKFQYLTKSSVQYIAELSGHSSYNITNYPTYWTFFDLTVNSLSAKFDESSDVDNFIHIAGLQPDDDVQVIWQANEHYPSAGWKEDSFKQGWQMPTPLYAPPKLTASITSDGNFLGISGDFTPYKGETVFYYISKSANNISTNDFPWVLARWNSTGPIATVIVRYTDGTESQIIPYGSESPDLTITIAKLDPDKEIAYMLVGITNLTNNDLEGLQTFDVDFILICKSE